MWVDLIYIGRILTFMEAYQYTLERLMFFQGDSASKRRKNSLGKQKPDDKVMAEGEFGFLSF